MFTKSDISFVRFSQWLHLSNFMRQQAMSSRMLFNRPIPVNRLVSSIADSAYLIDPPLCQSYLILSVIQRPKSTPKSMVDGHMVSASLSLAATRPDPTFTSSPHQATRMNITRCPSVHGVKARRHTSKSTLRALPTVRVFYHPSLW